MTEPFAPGAWRRTRSRIATEKRRDPQADTVSLKRQMKAEYLADYIRRTVDAAPELTPEQRDRLALLLKGGDAA